MERDAVAFIRSQTRRSAPPLLPELSLRLADDAIALWQRTEETFALSNSPPPYWAFAWAGGQALARYILDHPEIVRGAAVLDFAAGGGLVAIAAMKAGAATATASEIDPLALAATGINAADNAVAVTASGEDFLERGADGFDVVLAGDVFYERPMATRVEAMLRAAHTRGAHVLFGDPGRAYLPTSGIVELAAYDVPVPLTLEDREIRRTRVWRFA